MEERFHSVVQELGKASNEELQEFWKLISKKSVEITGSNRDEKIPELDSKFRKYGGCTLQREGMSYREIVCDVADYYSIRREGFSIPELEEEIAREVTKQTILEWSLDNIIKLYDCLNLDHEMSPKSESIPAAIPSVFRADGDASFRLFRCIVSATRNIQLDK